MTQRFAVLLVFIPLAIGQPEEQQRPTAKVRIAVSTSFIFN